MTSRGRVTIPHEIRERTGLLPNTEVEFRVQGSVVEITKAVREDRTNLGELLVERLRKHRPHVHGTTDEVMALTRGAD